ncbi:MAG: OmpA family protein [Pseudomonadota bacterium]
MKRNVVTAAMAGVIVVGLSGCANSFLAGPGTQTRQADNGLELVFGPAFFDYKTAELGAEGQREVELIARLLRQKPGREVIIEGHTDDVGSEGYNFVLSMARADAVKEALIEHGIEGDRLVVAAMGETLPASFSNTEDGRAKNRRVEVIIR